MKKSNWHLLWRFVCRPSVHRWYRNRLKSQVEIILKRCHIQYCRRKGLSNTILLWTLTCSAIMGLMRSIHWLKLEEAEEEGNPIGRPAVSTNLNPKDLSKTGPPTRQHNQTIWGHQHIFSRRLRVWTQSAKIHLTLKRQEEPGSGKVL